MARRRKGDKVDGWIIVDKPLERTSAQAVGAVKRATNAQKVGHGGTLDPLASGILPIGLGEATKTMPYIVDSSKDYDFTVKWGSETDTLDREGTVTKDGGRIPNQQEISDALKGFVGEIEQIPPAFSALKVNGKRAYALARDGQSVELAARHIQIHSLELVEHLGETGETRFKTCCGKGTYIRALARDIAYKLGTYGHVTVLRRTRVGPFALDQSISLEKLEELGHSARALDYVLPITTALDDIPAVAVTEREADHIKCGRTIPHTSAKQGTVILMMGETPVAIAQVGSQEIKPLRVFNMN